MAAPDTSITVPRDDLDDLYDYNVNDTDDVFRDFNANMDAPIHDEQSRTKTAPKTGADLGIDDEVQIIKKRKPIAKLDENRLLSQAGIPKLRRITKERLKFKGKGHEYSDVARLLNLYQLWLDDLYPRAKFADGLAIIEKLGHTKRIQTMRREWIKDSKPRDREDQQKPKDSTEQENARGDSIPEPSLPNSGFENNKTEKSSITNDADLYDATPEPPNTVRGEQKGKTLQRQSLFLSDDQDDALPPEDDLDALLAEDDLDALLAEDAQKETSLNLNNAEYPNQLSSSKTTPPDENFEDEMEAMAGMDDMW